MWWLNGSAPDCETCSPGFESCISPTCRDMPFLVGEPAGLAMITEGLPLRGGRGKKV